MHSERKYNFEYSSSLAIVKPQNCRWWMQTLLINHVICLICLGDIQHHQFCYLSPSILLFLSLSLLILTCLFLTYRYWRWVLRLLKHNEPLLPPVVWSSRAVTLVNGRARASRGSDWLYCRAALLSAHKRRVSSSAVVVPTSSLQMQTVSSITYAYGGNLPAALGEAWAAMLGYGELRFLYLSRDASLWQQQLQVHVRKASVSR